MPDHPTRQTKAKPGPAVPPDTDITLGLLTAVAAPAPFTQRRAAETLNIALGLVNAHLKRCVERGFLEVEAGPGNRRTYALTAAGQAERARLRADALDRGLDTFHRLRADTAEVMARCAANGWRRVALVGKSALCDIALLSAIEADIEVAGIIDADAAAHAATYLGLPIGATAHGMGAVHALIVTDMATPHQTFENAIGHFPRTRVLVPRSLEPAANPEA